MSRDQQQFLDLYCCLPNEFHFAYPQPQSSLYCQQKKKKIYRNTNALTSTSSLHLSKCKPKNLLHPYRISKGHHTDEIQPSEGKQTNKIMSIKSPDHEVEFYMVKESTIPHHSSQMADGDKKNKNTFEHTIDIVRPMPCKPIFNDSLKQSSDLKSFQNSISLLPLNRTSTWRKLQANITPSHYNHIQKFQQERQQQYPIMLSPLNKQPLIDPSETSKTMSSTSLSNSIQSIHVDQQILDDDAAKDNPFPTQNLCKTPSSQEIEEFQPVLEIIPSMFLNDILSSFFPTPSPNNNPLVFHSHHHIGKDPYMFFENPPDLTELLIINQPSAFIEPEFVFEPKKVHSLLESIEELCFLIRKLLQYELTEQKITPLQATIANQLAILLTYLALPNNEKIISGLITKDTMISTDDDDFFPQKPLVSTIGTQTDSLENEIIHTRKVISQTDLISTSVTLHLPGHRLNHARSDTFIYQIHHHQQYPSSNHQLISFSETTIHSLMHHYSRKEETKHLLKYLDGQKLQHYIELESSNTYLEGSTEFTPDFLLTTINNSKYDIDDNDQTEQFGIDTEKQDKIDTLTFNSIEKENYDSLSINESNIPKSSVTSISLNDDLVSYKNHFCQLLEPLLNTSQWQVPILPRKTNSIDVIYEKRTAKINLKHFKIRSDSNNGLNIIGKKVRIKSNSSSRISRPTIKLPLSREQSRKLSSLNYNNNCNEHISIDSLCSLESDTLDKNYPKSDKLVLHTSLPNISDNFVQTASLSMTYSSNLSDITDKFDSNIVLAQSLLDMLDSMNNNNNNNSSTMKIDLLHMYIRQFLIDFDARVRIDRKRRKNSNKKATH